MTDVPGTGQTAVDLLLKNLDLESLPRTDPDSAGLYDDTAEKIAAVYRGDSPQDGRQRVFGGQVAAQALVAAGRTVDPKRVVHSLHGYFVRGGDPSVPILYRVENVRDGRSFSVRRSVAFQHRKPIFVMSASFQTAAEGLDHQEPAPVVPGPDEVPTMAARLARYPERLELWQRIQRPIDLRYVTEPGWVAPGQRPPEESQRAWLRIDGRMPDDPLVHACVLTWASDLTLLDSVLAVHGEVWGPGGYAGASLDHALWFHRPFRVDKWLLYDCWSPSASGGRGLGTGRMYTRDGHHIATVIQEGLLRRVKSPVRDG